MVTRAGMLSIEEVKMVSDRALTSAAAQQAGYGSRAELVESLGDREGELYRIRFSLAGEDPRIALRQQDALSAGDVEELKRRLERLDAYSKQGPWTMAVLRIIEEKPAKLAADLAAELGYEKSWFKPNVRKLKKLGLTESLKVGYRISPRGEAFLRAVE